MRIKTVAVLSEAEQKVLQKKNVIWNLIGSIIYAALSIVLLMVVTRLIGDEQAGVFSIAFTTGQIMLALGLYNVRPVQATDINSEYSFGDYFSARFITCAAMLITSGIYIAFSGYTFEKGLIVALLCFYKVFDAFGDVFEGQTQKLGFLYLGRMGLALRSIFSGMLFSLALYFTKDLVLSCFVLLISGIAGFLVFNVLPCRGLFAFRPSKALASIKRLLLYCLPLCISSFMALYISNAPKYSIDQMMSSNYQAYYNMIFMPAFAINLCYGFIFTPLLNTFAEIWNEKRHGDYFRMILKQLLIVAGLTVAALLVGWFLGIPVLSWFYATDLSEYRPQMMLLLLGGGFAAVNSMLFYALTVIRDQMKTFWGYLITFACALAFPPFFVAAWGITGAALSYLLLTIVMAIVFFLLFCLAYWKHIGKA